MNSIHTFVVLAYKDSKYLEKCIQSVINQEYKSKVVIATSTPNEYIDSYAKKYDLKVFVNPNNGQGIGADFDFAVSCGQTDLITVAHQDDVYEHGYSKKIVENYEKNKDAIIIFTNYYEIKGEKKDLTNINLKIKRILLFPLSLGLFLSKRFMKRSCLCFGNSVCCPAVTFVRKNIKLTSIFSCSLKCDVDWYAWEKLSNESGKFVYSKDILMGHRVHDESTTTEIIKDNIRTKEDFIMFCKFWPKPIAKVLNKFYIKSEKNNQV